MQFALLQALQTQQIGRGRMVQRIDRRIEVAMLLLEPRQFCTEIVIIIHEVRLGFDRGRYLARMRGVREYRLCGARVQGVAQRSRFISIILQPRVNVTIHPANPHRQFADVV